MNLIKYLPENYVRDGTVDYTENIQKGIDSNRVVLIPNFPILVNVKGIRPRSGSRILFQPNSSFKMISNSEEKYGIIRITNISDVIIYYPNLIGERESHIGDKGEWGMGIFLLGSNNILIENPKISNCWGDGIYIGGINQKPSCNIKIVNAEIDNCRRNGISITDGKNITIQKPIISNTNGTSPMCGIDIEPNNSNATIANIKLINPITFNNSNSGILISLNKLVGFKPKTLSIRIDNHLDNQSDKAVSFGKYKDHDNNVKSLTGNISFTNPRWLNNRLPLYVTNNTFGPKVIFKNLYIPKGENKQNNRINEIFKIRNFVNQ